MTLEEMIRLLSHEPEYQFAWVDMEIKEAKAIAAALRRLERLEKAGQAMRAAHQKQFERGASVR